MYPTLSYDPAARATETIERSLIENNSDACLFASDGDATVHGSVVHALRLRTRTAALTDSFFFSAREQHIERAAADHRSARGEERVGRVRHSGARDRRAHRLRLRMGDNGPTTGEAGYSSVVAPTARSRVAKHRSHLSRVRFGCKVDTLATNSNRFPAAPPIRGLHQRPVPLSAGRSGGIEAEAAWDELPRVRQSAGRRPEDRPQGIARLKTRKRPRRRHCSTTARACEKCSSDSVRDSARASRDCTWASGPTPRPRPRASVQRSLVGAPR